jgi:predicted small secreted protein
LKNQALIKKGEKMKHSKVFLLILIITVLALAVSACNMGTGGGNDISLKGQRVAATISSMDESGNVEFSVMTATLSNGDGSFAGNAQFGTLSGSGAAFTVGSNIVIRTVSGSAAVSFDGSAQYETKVFYASAQVSGIKLQYVKATVAPELLEGFAVGDSVYVTFDNDGNVTKIEKREVITNGKDDKDNKDKNDKDDKLDSTAESTQIADKNGETK